MAQNMFWKLIQLIETIFNAADPKPPPSKKAQNKINKDMACFEKQNNENTQQEHMTQLNLTALFLCLLWSFVSVDFLLFYSCSYFFILLFM